MHACMYVCMYACMHVCMYVCACMCVGLYVCVCVFVYVCMNVNVCMHICMYVCMDGCMDGWMHARMHAEFQKPHETHVYMYIYIYTIYIPQNACSSRQKDINSINRRIPYKFHLPAASNINPIYCRHMNTAISISLHVFQRRREATGQWHRRTGTWPPSSCRQWLPALGTHLRVTPSF